MTNAENAAGRTIRNIHDRLTKTRIFKNVAGRPLTAKEKLLKAIISPETPIARSEIFIPPEKAQALLSSANNVRTWIISHAATYTEEPNSRVDDEEGWSYNQGGFEMSADDATKPSSLSSVFLLSITETSPHDPSVEVWFSIVQDNKYNLEIRYFKTPERKQGEVIDTYISDDKSVEEMAENDGVIIEDLLIRVSAHLGI